MAKHRGDTDTQLSFLRSLRTVRHFRPDPVPREVVDNALEVARWSGSARNRQPWEFLVVRKRQTLKRLAALEGYAGHLAGAAVGIILVMAGEPKRFEQETFDEGRLAERIALAAASQGVGSAVGWFKGGGRDVVKRILTIPPRRLVRTAISLGYPGEPPLMGRPALPQGRKPLAELVHEERYG